jgi:hypothetical protein
MITLASAIEIVEQLPTDQQDILVQIIRDRQIERRREEIAQNGHETLAAYRAGELKSYTAKEAIAQLRNILDSPDVHYADANAEEIQNLQAKLDTSDRYEISVTNNEIIFKKIPKKVLTWEELSQRIEASGEDPDQPSLQEISQIVKDVRKSRKAEIA